jgi:integrase
MSYKFNRTKGTYEAWVVQRNPITKKPETIRRKGISTKSEAVRVEAQIRELLSNKFKRELVSTLQTCVKLFLDEKAGAGLKNKTVSGYGDFLQAVFVREVGDVFIDEITDDRIRSFFTQYYSDRQPRTKKNGLNHLRQFFQFCLRKGFVKSDPVPQLHFRYGSKIKQGLNEKQLKLLLSEAKNLQSKWYLIWVTAAYTGMRSGELFALTWRQIDFDNGKIIVDRMWTSKDGYTDRTKNGGHRMIDLPPALALELRANLPRNAVQSDFVLPHLRAWEKGEQAKEIRRFTSGLGLPMIRFHDLRASWATLLLTNGVAATVVMAMGGWHDLKTMNKYLRLAGLDVDGAQSRIDLRSPDHSERRLVVARILDTGSSVSD